mgnify:CR=1 FL=1
MRKVITLLIPFLSLVAVNLTASPAGKWDVVAETAYGETYRLALTLTESDGKLGGTLTTPDGGTVQLQNVRLEGSNLTFEISLGGSLYTVESKIENDEITGTWKGGGDSGTVAAKRAQ